MWHRLFGDEEEYGDGRNLIPSVFLNNFDKFSLSADFFGS
jgi:hypothetical protein